jgi:hypothetical protein
MLIVKGNKSLLAVSLHVYNVPLSHAKQDTNTMLGGKASQIFGGPSRSGRQRSFSTVPLGIFYEKRFNAEASLIELKSFGQDWPLLHVTTHDNCGLQTKPLKLRIDLTITCAQFHWFGLSPVLSLDVAATRLKTWPNRLLPPSMDRSDGLHGCNRPNCTASTSIIIALQLWNDVLWQMGNVNGRFWLPGGQGE